MRRVERRIHTRSMAQQLRNLKLRNVRPGERREPIALTLRARFSYRAHRLPPRFQASRPDSAIPIFWWHAHLPLTGSGFLRLARVGPGSLIS